MTDEQTAKARVIRFFEGELPAIIAARGELFDRSQGSIACHIEGAGAWQIHFGDRRAPNAVEAGATLDAQLVAVWAAEAFARMLEQEGSLADFRPIVLGDIRLLSRLGALLQPAAKGGVGARMWGL
jgi:hypothetical protein